MPAPAETVSPAIEGVRRPSAAQLIAVSDIHKQFSVRDGKTGIVRRIDALRGISFTVTAGEIYGLLGPNGAGKSTTLRILGGLMRPDRGTVAVGGMDVGMHAQQVRASVGFLSPEASVYTRFTPREYLKMFGEFQGLAGVDAEKRGMALLEQLEIADFADVAMSGFSTGQRQKVSISRALLHDPEVVIFDEPTTGLDVLTARTVIDLLLRMKAEGRAVVLSTHALPMVETVCDRVGIIFQGRLHGDAPLTQMLAASGAGSLDEVFFRIAGQEEAQ